MNLCQCLPRFLQYAAHIVVGVQDGIGVVPIFFSTMDIAYKLIGEIGWLPYWLSD